MLRDDRWDQKLIVVRNNGVDEIWNGAVKLGEITWTDISGKKSLDVNVTEIVISANSDSIETRNKPMSLLVDKTTTANVTYIGEASPGSSEASSLWRVFILDNTTSVTKKKWASNGDFVNSWNNRASLTYV